MSAAQTSTGTEDGRRRLVRRVIHALGPLLALITIVFFFAAAVQIRNALDEEYMVAGFDVPVLGGFAGLRGPRRQFGGRFRLRF